jgi:hydroxymethylglutaryl-CoA lyase
MRNTHKTIAESLVTLDEILEIADKTNKKVCLFVYGFGNPYGDPWDVEIVGDWTKLSKMGGKFCLFPILLVILL